MGHKTLINGTAYEITSGRILINGTVYSVDKGKTRVGGTGYDIQIGFESLLDFGTITLTQGTANYSYNEIIPTPEIDFSLCDTLVVNGVAYAVVYTYSESSIQEIHRFGLINTSTTEALSEENPYQCIVSCRQNGEQKEWRGVFQSYIGGTYEVSLGRL